MLKGSPELRRRLKAVRTIFKSTGRDWADQTVIEARQRVRVRTGETQRSIRRKNASMKRATVVGRYPVNFIDSGAKEHDITPRKMQALKFTAGGQTIFRKRVHKQRQAAHPFKRESALAGLEKVDVTGEMIRLWNEAA